MSRPSEHVFKCTEYEVQAGPQDEQITYTYDANGNWTKVETATGTEPTTQTTTLDAMDATDDALLCMSDGTTYTYSERGALSSKQEMTTSDDCAANPLCYYNDCATTTYDYDAMGNLASVVLHDDRTCSARPTHLQCSTTAFVPLDQDPCTTRPRHLQCSTKTLAVLDQDSCSARPRHLRRLTTALAPLDQGTCAA